MLEFSGFFIAGVLTTLTLIAIIKQYNKRSRAKRILVNQSSMFLLIKNFLPDLMFDMKYRDTQAFVYEDTRTFRYIEMSDHKAYWMDKNKIYYAEIKDGRFNPATGKPTEMSNLSEKQVNKMLYILNTLKNGS
jgi:hypothetical protein